MKDQLILYDQAVITWVKDNFPTLLVGNVTQVMMATPKKKFAEVTTGLLVNNRTLSLPRVTVQRLETINDPTRFNPNRIRRLGFVNPPNKNTRLTGKFPTPINITYQLDLWTRLVSEMNLWERFIMDTFVSSYMYLQIRPNDIWRDKKYFVALEGAIVDNSDLEPDEADVAIRKTVTIRCECWYFDDVFVRYGVVKAFETELRNSDNQLLETSFLPPIERVATSVNGVTTIFSYTTERENVLKNSLVVSAIIGGVTIISEDDGIGNMLGTDTLSGTINYVTGDLSIVFTTAPDVGTNVTVTYFTDI